MSDRFIISILSLILTVTLVACSSFQRQSVSHSLQKRAVPQELQVTATAQVLIPDDKRHAIRPTRPTSVFSRKKKWLVTKKREKERKRMLKKTLRHHRQVSEKADKRSLPYDNPHPRDVHTQSARANSKHVIPFETKKLTKANKDIDAVTLRRESVAASRNKESAKLFRDQSEPEEEDAEDAQLPTDSPDDDPVGFSPTDATADVDNLNNSTTQLEHFVLSNDQMHQENDVGSNQGHSLELKDTGQSSSVKQKETQQNSVNFKENDEEDTSEDLVPTDVTPGDEGKELTSESTGKTMETGVTPGDENKELTSESSGKTIETDVKREMKPVTHDQEETDFAELFQLEKDINSIAEDLFKRRSEISVPSNP